VTTRLPGHEITQVPRRRAAARNQWRALAALLGALFLGNVDVAVANIAGPSIRAGLNASGGELELVVSGCTLAYAVLLVTGARLGEARGYRRMFLAGLAGFTVASLACAPEANIPGSDLCACSCQASSASTVQSAALRALIVWRFRLVP
jgi:MFS family permease